MSDRLTRCAMYDASVYPDDALNVALSMICDSVSVTRDQDASVAIVSCVHPQQSDVVARIAKKHTTTIVGGPGALSPGAFEAASMVVLGDYARFFEVATTQGLSHASRLPNVFLPSDPQPVEIDESFPWHLSGRYRAEDGRVQIYCSRGCRRKCAFCQVGWSQNFKESPDQNGIIEQIDQNPKHALVSNALNEVSFYDRLPHSGAASHTFAHIVNQPVCPGQTVRVGIEGVSQRLRKAVAKPISNEALVNGTISLNQKGAAVRWFLIAGLPYESWDDWVELQQVVSAYVMNHERQTLQLSFTAFCPDPATPLAHMDYSDEYYDHYLRFKDWYFCKVRHPNLSIFNCQKPQTRNAKAAYAMHPLNRYVQYPHIDKIPKAIEHYKRCMGIGS